MKQQVKIQLSISTGGRADGGNNSGKKKYIKKEHIYILFVH